MLVVVEASSRSGSTDSSDSENTLALSGCIVASGSGGKDSVGYSDPSGSQTAFHSSGCCD